MIYNEDDKQFTKNKLIESIFDQYKKPKRGIHLRPKHNVIQVIPTGPTCSSLISFSSKEMGDTIGDIINRQLCFKHLFTGAPKKFFYFDSSLYRIDFRATVFDDTYDFILTLLPKAAKDQSNIGKLYRFLSTKKDYYFLPDVEISLNIGQLPFFIFDKFQSILDGLDSTAECFPKIRIGGFVISPNHKNCNVRIKIDLQYSDIVLSEQNNPLFLLNPPIENVQFNSMLTPWRLE